MITIDNTPVEEALAKAAPIHDQAHDLALTARRIECMALAAWYQSLVRQVIDANVSPKDTLPWSVRRTVNCFVDTGGKYIEPIVLFGYVKAGWLDWVNLWVDATTRYERENISAEADRELEQCTSQPNG